MFDIFLAYGAGILTLINPCVLPVLPLVLASSLQSGRYGPLALAAGMSIAFVGVGMFVLTFGASIGLTQALMSQIGASLMVGFGLILLIPQLNSRFALVAGGLASGADAQINGIDQSSHKGVFFSGTLLGLVWSPCIGPTLGGAISLASQSQDLGFATAVMTSFALGVSTIIIALGFGTRQAIRGRQSWMQPLAERSKFIMGGLLLAVGIMILSKLDRVIEQWLIGVLPQWLLDLSTSI